VATETVRLREEARRVIRKAFGKVRAQAQPTEVKLRKGGAGVHDPNEVLLLVLGPHGGLVSRRSLRGRGMDLRELGLLLVGAQAAVEGLTKESVAPSPPLTGTEASLLDEAGLVENGDDLPGAFEKSRIAFELLLRQSFTLARAAKVLDVNPSRLRQRLKERTLYGIKEGRSWKVPAFQFDAKRKKLVRGIEKVLPRVRASAHPLAVATWFSAPHQDLVVGNNDTPVSPLQWLAGGGSIGIVADLAEEI
jgi:hypothetical protein